MAKTDWVKIAARIREIREKSSLNQTEFGKHLGGLPQTLVSKYERGTIRPPLDFLVGAADLGKVSLDWLVRGKKS